MYAFDQMGSRIRMEISFDPAKGQRTLAQRRLDFADAAKVFSELTATVEDKRKS